MRKLICFSGILLFSISITLGQKGRGGTVGKDMDNFNPEKDFYYRYSKAIKKTQNVGLVRGALHFKRITSDYKLVGKGQDRTTTKAWAILKGVSDQTLQEISDEFAISFSKKIAALGISTVDWTKIKASKGFQKLLSKQIEKQKSNTNVGFIDIKTVHTGPHTRQLLGNPGTINAYKKIAKETASDALTYDIIIDFARFNIDAERRKSMGYNSSYKFVKTSVSTNALPQIVIKNNNSAATFGMVATNLSLVTKNGGIATISLKKSIFYPENYALEMTSYDGKLPKGMKSLITFNTMTTGTFVIKADEAKYKEVVLKALDKYSDYLIELIKTEIRK